MRKTVLITGGSGSVGRDLVRLWASRNDVSAVLLVHKRIPEFTNGFSRPNRLVWGDVTRPGLGLRSEVRRSLQDSVTHILHSAANTRFDSDWETAYRTNVAGTLNALDFARGCGRLRHFGHVSTAFVSGKREGVIMENDLDQSVGFTNHYERSKSLAERAIREVGNELPVAVYRPSIIFGDSVTGEVNDIQASHRTIRMMYLIGPECMPGREDYIVDLVPSDVVAATISTLLLDVCEPGIFHVTSGRDKSLTLQTFFQEIYRLYAHLDADWKDRNFKPPLIVPSSTMFQPSGSSEHRHRDVLRMTRHFASQLDHPKVFDQTHLLRCLPHYQERLPHCREYLPRVIAYLLRTNWCRKAA